MTPRGIVVAVDASNLRAGGGITHLVQILTHAEPAMHGVGRVRVWGSQALLERLPSRPWLERYHDPLLERSVAARTAWQISSLGRWCVRNCDVLFVPGGQYAGMFRPYVTMCRNMLPFEAESMELYGWSPTGIRLRMLRHLQARTFREAAGVIFLTDVARRTVTTAVGPLRGRSATIPHGISDAFRLQPRQQHPIAYYNEQRPFQWLYVSIIDLYKHQPEVMEAVAHLRNEGFPVSVHFVGSAYPPAGKRLNDARAKYDPAHAFSVLREAVPHDQLPAVYHGADGFVFASSCENLPNILLEAMAAGLPITCSDRNVMRDVLRDAGEYFAASDAISIAQAMRALLLDPDRRASVAGEAFQQALAYQWARCATETFGFLASGAMPRVAGRN